ncbi:hypothetical protein [Streptomyces sp. NPDC017529]|uniref:hypothetical protein n=1 Tax=Streptomyces sp. NPDC017529 TaxID=3365000 RepID=UPI0037BB4633
MTYVATGITAVFVAVGYAWPFLPLVVYPFDRRRGMWVAAYCGAAGFLAGYVVFRYSDHAVGTFFQASVFTSAARIVGELTGAGERLRRRRAKPDARE